MYIERFVNLYSQLKMWEKFNANSVKEEKKDAKDKPLEEEKTLRIPEWLERYIEYKFNLLDRAGRWI